MSDTGVLISLDADTTEASRVVLDYTNRDFTSIRSQLIGLAKGIMPDWATAGEPADFGTVLLELFAYMGDVMHFYIDRTASEAFLGTAVRRNSVLYIADMMGYHPIGQSSALVTLDFLLDEDALEAEIGTVTIPVGTRVHNSTSNSANLVAFELQEEVVLSRDPAAVTAEDPEPWQRLGVLAQEGLTIRDYKLGVANGVPNTEFQIPEKGVIYRTVSIVTREGFVNVKWEFITDLSLARPTQAVFTTYTDEEGFTYVVFGDNAAGRIPTTNAEVFATYRIGVGAVANDMASGSVDVILPPASIDGLEFVSVTNDGAPVGGADPESIESMKHSIPRSAARMKNRAVTLNDYADLALQVPGVAKSVAYGTVYTLVHVKIALVSDTGVVPAATMEAKCKEVEAYMQDKILIGSAVQAEPLTSEELFFDPPDSSSIYIRIVIHVAETYNRAAVRQQVDAVIRKLLAYETVNFGTPITMGAIYRAALAVQGVERVDLRWLSTNAPPQQIPESETGLGGVSGIFTGEWEYSVVVTTGDPGVRHYRLNNPDNPTLFMFSETDHLNANRSGTSDVGLSDLRIGDQFLVRPTSNTAAWRSFIVTSTPVDHGAWWDLSVTKSNEATGAVNPNNNQEALFDFYRPNPTPGTLIEIHDIFTNELLIPRIEPTLVTETDTDFPNMSVDELEHDGLWVWAVGGLQNT